MLEVSLFEIEKDNNHRALTQIFYGSFQTHFEILTHSFVTGMHSALHVYITAA